MPLYKLHRTHIITKVKGDLYLPMIDSTLRKNIQDATSAFGTPKTGPAIIFCMRRHDKEITRIVKVSSLERSLPKFQDSCFVYFYKKINQLISWDFILESKIEYAST